MLLYRHDRIDICFSGRSGPRRAVWYIPRAGGAAVRPERARGYAQPSSTELSASYAPPAHPRADTRGVQPVLQRGIRYSASTLWQTFLYP